MRSIEVDGSIATLGACLTIGAGLALGLVTASHAARAADAGVQGARGAIDGPGQWRRAAVGAQVCLAVLLVAGAAVALQGFREISAAFASLRPAQLLAFDIRLPAWRYADDRRAVDFVDRLLAAMRTMPEIQSAGLIRNPPASNVPSPLTSFVVDRNAAPPPSDAPRAEVQIVTADAFRTLDAAIVRGRGVTREDTPDSPRVAVISETMARRFWSDRDPLGATLRLGLSRDAPDARDVRIVGIVSDVRLKLKRRVDPDLRVRNAAGGNRSCRTAEMPWIGIACISPCRIDACRRPRFGSTRRDDHRVDAAPCLPSSLSAALKPLASVSARPTPQ